MRARFLDKDPDCFATDRSNRVSYITQGWKMTNPQALTDVGPVPGHKAPIEIPEDVLKMYARHYGALASRPASMFCIARTPSKVSPLAWAAAS